MTSVDTGLSPLFSRDKHVSADVVLLNIITFLTEIVMWWFKILYLKTSPTQIIFVVPRFEGQGLKTLAQCHTPVFFSRNIQSFSQNELKTNAKKYKRTVNNPEET